MIRGFYVERDSPIHRLPAGLKLAFLPLAGTLLFLTSGPVWALGALLVVALLVIAAQIPARAALAQLRAALPMLAVLLAAQWFIAGPAAAVLVVLRFAALILAASLVTLTTRTAEMIAALERVLSPLRLLGVDPARVSLAISLAIRFIPVIATIAEEVREAQRARGGERSILALTLPIIVRTLKMADEIAEAIDARS